ncbi:MULTISPECIES: hypothetical protein [unclassified Bradyrhizobium]|uniref:hypothetical protein n=1 Tax=unclassified Bradyrhizobium TaxID=2631580 RepID=UPI001FFA190E|nr:MULTISPECIES: hypothetical protein [unclassified Bradyrhizobium]MCK1715804.1 hypothetical protein [Bradyrhizobium sp. 143]MCK1726818.1 hypothetical protein [Bradyrhizobium sp. 142]
MKITHMIIAARGTKPAFELIEDETLHVEKKRGLAQIMQEELEATFDRLLRDFMQRSPRQCQIRDRDEQIRR